VAAAEAQAQAARVVAAVLAGRSLTEALPAATASLAEPRQARAVQDLSFGTLRHLARLQTHLKALAPRPVKDSLLRALLLVGLNELRAGRAPHPAVVHQTVEAARSLGKPWAAGFVNGVLRHYLRKAQALEARADQDETTRFSYPGWWIERLARQYPDQYQNLLAAGLSHPPMTLRINRRRTSPEAYRAMLAEAGMESTPLGPVALRLRKPVPVEALPGFREGLVSVQDAGAQQAAYLLALEPGQRVLDACAAPGGKTAHILETADVRLTAVDRDPRRLERVKENLHRLGLSAQLVAADAANPTWWDGEPFDRILADVPCSASGVVRRHPDAKWLRRPQEIAAFAREQARLLVALWRLLAPGGTLLYATCSLFAEENQEVIQDFLARQPDARPDPLPASPAGFLQLLPDENQDGFFYARLRKLPA